MLLFDQNTAISRKGRVLSELVQMIFSEDIYVL